MPEPVPFGEGDRFPAEDVWRVPSAERRPMTLGEFRAILLKSVFDDSQDLLDTLTANRYINMAAKHIANWADRQDQAVCVAVASVTGIRGVATEDLKEVPFYGGVGTFGIDPDVTPFRRALVLYRTNYGTEAPYSQTTQLDLVRFEDVTIHSGPANDTKPKAAIARQALFLIRALSEDPGIDLRLHYVYSLPDMEADGDYPGQHNGEGTMNALPAEYHPLVAVFAIKMALAAENADMSQWEAMYTEMLAELHATFGERRGTRTGGSK